MAILKNTTVTSTDGVVLPTGTSAEKLAAKVEIFRTLGSQTWTCPVGVTSVAVLVVGGGGGGGLCFGGGGGGGGVVYHPNFSVTPGTNYTIVVGAGGTGSTGSTGTNGGNSQFSSLTANGGGAGGAACGGSGNAGGSGGGASSTGSGGATNQGSFPGATSYGNAGSSGQVNVGSGGGGAGGVGRPGTQAQGGGLSIGGDGGPGIANDITGSLVYYGGGGGSQGSKPGIGGVGGGADGCNGFPQTGNPGVDGLGGGGGGGLQTTYGDVGSPSVATSSGRGGSGVVILRYTPSSSTAAATGQIRHSSTGNIVETYTSRGWNSIKNKPLSEIGMTRESAAESALQIKQITGTTVNGWYWLNPGGLGPAQFWCDMNYLDGGWVMVLSNRINTGGVNNLNYQAAMGAQVNLRGGRPGDKLEHFNCWVGLKYWNYLRTLSSTQATIVQFVSTGAVDLSSTGSHTKRARWSFQYVDARGAMMGASFINLDVGDVNPGMYSSHTGSPLSAWDYSQDSYGASFSGCANLYNNNPWWYGACWSGNYFAANGYQDGPYWNSSTSDYHNYGAVYIK